MKIIAQIGITDQEWEKLRPTIESSNIFPTKIFSGTPSHGTLGLVQFRLPVDDERYILLKKEMVEKGIRNNEKKEIRFDPQEIEEAEYSILFQKSMWGYPQPEDDYQNESYDLSSGCQRCRQGLKQNKPFMLSGKPKFGRNDITALFWIYESIITEKLKDLIENEGLTGAEFWPVLRYRKTGQRLPIPGIYQLYVRGELPPVSPKTQFEWVSDLPKEIQSCGCNIIGRNLPAAQLVYDRVSLRDAKDFNRTFEFIGGGPGSQQWKVVSNRVYRLFKKNAIRGADFRPIVIND